MTDVLQDATLAVLLAGLPLAAIYANRSAQTVLAAALLLAIAARVARPSGAPARPFLAVPPLWSWPLMAGIAFATLSALWAVDPGYSFERGLKLAALAAMGLALWRLLPPLTQPWHHLAAAWAIGAAAIISAVELLGEGVLRQTFYSHNPSDMNRTLVTLSLLMWPALAIAAPRAGRGLMPALIAVVAVAVFLSQSVSAQLGLLIGLLTLVLAWWSLRFTVMLLAGGSAVAFVTLPLLVNLTHSLVHGPLQGLPIRTKPEVRLDIWNWYSEAAWHKPVFGWGLESSRFFGVRDLSHVAPDYVWPSLAWHHPHNLVIQLWVDLGATGVLLIGSATVLLCLSIRRLAPMRRPYACALFAAAFTIAVVSHGAWQTWWLSMLAAAILMLAMKDAVDAAPDTGAVS